MNACTDRKNTHTQQRIETILEQLRGVYGEPKRQNRQEPIDELVATILSQATSDSNTARAFESLTTTFEGWDAVADAPEADLVDAIRAGGLAQQKAPRIQRMLSEIRDMTGGFNLDFLDEMSAGKAASWLTQFNGVGPKTAACVLLFAFNRDVMPVDTHVHRVAQRLGLIDRSVNAAKAQPALEDLIPPGECYSAHLLFIQHGRQICKARKPRCRQCVLNDLCPSAEHYISGEDID